MKNDSCLPLIRVVGPIQVDVLLAPKQAIEFRPDLVEP